MQASPKKSPRKSPRSSFANAASDETDHRHHMEHYGTFKMDSVHARLFELQTFIESYNYHVMVYLVFGIVGLVLWPVAAFLAIPVAYVAGKDRDMQMGKVLLVLGTIIGAMIWIVPLVIVYGPGGGGSAVFYKLIDDKQLNFLDIVDCMLSQFMLLLTVVFAWTFHDIARETDKYKEATQESWNARSGEYGVDVWFPQMQLERLQDTLAVIKTGEKAPSSAAPPGGGTLPVADVIVILEDLPGWHSKCMDTNDHMSDYTGAEVGLFEELAKLSEEAKAKKIWPIDIWLTRTQFYPEEELDLMAGLQISIHSLKDMIGIIIHYMQIFMPAAIVLVTLSLIRTFLPRIWLWKVLGGEFWPTSPQAANLVLYSTILTFVVSMIWLGLFYMIVMEYRRTAVQTMIVSALVEPKARVRFSQCYLMSCMWFGLDPQQTQDVLAKLPLLDLTKSSNVAAFWRIREYCTLDRCNERLSISVLLTIIIIWLLVKFVCTVAVVMAYEGELPAILVVTLFDLVVFGSLAIFALQIALQINAMMEDHKQAIVTAKYFVTMAAGRLEDSDEQAKLHGTSVEEKRHDLNLSRRLLAEYLDISNEADMDNRDSILFGMVVTPAKILSSVATGAAMVGTLLLKMVKSGDIKAPEAVTEHAHKHGMFLAKTAAQSFLAMYNKHVHSQ